MKRKILIVLAVLCALLLILTSAPLVRTLLHARYGVDLNGDIVLFDSCVSSFVTSLDFKMSKEGYKIENKVVDTLSENGADEIQPHNGVKMRLLRIISHYSKPAEVVSHNKSAYQKSLAALEKAFGRLPDVFYAIDMTKYEGERVEKSTETKVESVFLLLEDKKDRLIGGSYYAYGGTMGRLDEHTFRQISETGQVLEEYTQREAAETEHFEGDLNWLKNKAYNNYVSPIELKDAFEVLE